MKRSKNGGQTPYRLGTQRPPRGTISKLDTPKTYKRRIYPSQKLGMASKMTAMTRETLSKARPLVTADKDTDRYADRQRRHHGGDAKLEGGWQIRQ